MNGPEFVVSAHDGEQHRAAKADDEVTEVSPPKRRLSTSSEAEDPIVRVKHSNRQHIANHGLAVARRQPIERRSEPPIQVRTSNARLL
jgi:hypothetical protein